MVKSIDAGADIREFATMEGVYETVMSLHFDLFILDIIMDMHTPGDTSGIEFAEHLRTISKYKFTPIIFTSVLEDPKMYAYSRIHSFSYIEKPFRENELREAIKEALCFEDAGNRDKTLFWRTDGILYSVKCQEIVYAEIVLRNLYIHKVGGEEICIKYKTIKELLQQADCDQLVQCGRNVLINKDYVESIDPANRIIRMQNTRKVIAIGSSFVNKIIDEFFGDV